MKITSLTAVIREFANDDFGVNQIFNQNNPDMFFDSAVLSALIGSCCFVYVSADSDSADPVRLQVIEASNATGVIDPIPGFDRHSRRRKHQTADYYTVRGGKR